MKIISGVRYDSSDIKVGDLVVMLKGNNAGFTYRVARVPQSLGQIDYEFVRGSINLMAIATDFRKIKIDNWVGIKVYPNNDCHNSVVEGVVVDGPSDRNTVRVLIKKDRVEFPLKDLVPMYALDITQIVPAWISGLRRQPDLRLLLVTSETEGDLLAELHHQLEQKEVLASFNHLLKLRFRLEQIGKNDQKLVHLDGFISGLVGPELWKKICYLMTTEKIGKRLKGGS